MIPFNKYCSIDVSPFASLKRVREFSSSAKLAKLHAPIYAHVAYAGEICDTRKLTSRNENEEEGNVAERKREREKR